MRFLIIGAVIAGALLAEPRGPFTIEIPMRGLTPTHFVGSTWGFALCTFVLLGSSAEGFALCTFAR